MSQRWTRRLALLLPATFLAGCLGSPDEPLVIEMISLLSVDVGAFHACGLTAGGRAYCWGANGSGQLGEGQFFDQPVPRPVAGNVEFVALAPGGFHTCGLASGGELYCWGNNGQGQLGRGLPSAPEPKPVLVTTTRTFVSTAAGAAHACGLTGAGAAWCWGSAESGRLGNSQSGFRAFRGTPDSVRGGLTFTALSAGGEHTCGLLLADSTAYCWGGSSRGQVGDGTTTDHVEPVAVAGSLVFIEISAGGEHTCAVSVDDSAYCWGLGESGQLGTGATANQRTPTLVSGGLEFVSISAGGSHTCGLTSSNEAYCWGLNDSGQLGDGSTTNRPVPTRVSGNTLFQSVAAGTGPFNTASCGYGVDNVAYCWGYGVSGQVGNGQAEDVLTPVPVAGQVN